MITCHAIEQPRKDAERRLRTRGLDRLFDEGASATGFAQPQGARHQKREQPRLPAQRFVLLCNDDCEAKGIDAGKRFATKDLRHPVCDCSEESSATGGVIREEFDGPSRRAQHRRDVPRVEARLDRLGEHGDRHLRFRRCGALGSVDEDGVTLHHRAAAHGDMPPQLLDLDASLGVDDQLAGFGQQADGTVGGPCQPRRVSRRCEQLTTLRVIASEPGSAFESSIRDAVRAALTSSLARLSECGRCRVVGSDRCSRKVPRSAVGVAIGKRTRDRSMRRATFLR